MGKKYIIELLDDCQSEFKGIMVFGLTQEKQISVELIPEESLRPYTEPDTEQVRKEAYENGYENGFIAGHLKAEKSGQSFYEDGYKRGLADAWEAARKIGSNSICSLEEMGFDFSQCAVDDYNPSWFVVKNYSASEAIEKIRAYEQRQEEIKVGDEVEAMAGNAVVIEVIDGGQTVRYMYPDTITGRNKACNVTRTGRHFPEIAEVLQKMKEEA